MKDKKYNTRFNKKILAICVVIVVWDIYFKIINHITSAKPINGIP